MKNDVNNYLIADCKKGDRKSQKELYRKYYSYGLTICLHYSKNREEAEEILNDGFVKAFTRLDQFKFQSSFQSWLRQILVHAAIDYYRKYHRKSETWNVVHLKQSESVENMAVHNLSMDDALRLLQQLPPSYRIVFNLFVLDGYSHAEIAEVLNIGIGTSKSNLSIARKKLQKLAAAYYEIKPKLSNQ